MTKILRKPGTIAAIIFLPFGWVVGWSVWAEFRESSRAKNEMEAYRILQDLREMEDNFRKTDRDGNGVEDFWTGDVAGLHRYGLLERSVAEADAAPLNPLVLKPVPHHGYFFVALDRDCYDGPPEPYRQDTDHRSGKVHHRFKYGFCAYPAEPGVSGRRVYIVNENRTVLFATDVPPPKDWLPEATLKSWSKF